MSQRANQGENSPSPLEEKKEEQASQNANAAGEQPKTKSPEEAANDELGATGETPAQKIAKAVDAVYQVNPELGLDEIIKLVTSIFLKQENPKTQVEKEAARLIPAAINRDIRKQVFLKKDKDRKFPLDESALDGIIVRQTYKKKTEEGDDIVVPARNLNEIGIYSEDEFERLSEPGRGFAREGITVEVWHKPGQKDTVQED